MGLGQNGVVLSFFEPKQRRFGLVTSASKRRRFVVYLKKKKNDVILSPAETKRSRFSTSPTQKHNPLFVYLVCIERIGGGGGGRKKTWPLGGIDDLT